MRGQVERAFGTLKRSYGWRRVRYRGLVRNGAHLHLLCIALNLRRAARLAPRQGRCARNSPLRRRGRRQRRANRRSATPLAPVGATDPRFAEVSCELRRPLTRS
ncbi:transposase [Rubritepida flocculans]|uniref:transposase n=1 Tax=Rubritepida flocculans TaxID=182403 RepID=UPI0038CD6019